jgi:signal transduction histidine kinase
VAVLAVVTVREIAAHPTSYPPAELISWIVILATIELLPVPAWRGLQLSLGFPIRLGMAILYPPGLAASLAWVGSFDPRELRRERRVLTSLFDRSQISLSVLAGSATFHFLAHVQSPWFILIPAVFAATVSDYAVNVFLVAVYMRLTSRVRMREVVSQLRLGALSQFLLSYLGLSFVGAVIARLFLTLNVFAVAVFVLPLVFARQMFFRTMALEEAHKELKDRERVLRALSNRMAEERQDERLQIAGYLHDDLAQMLFRLTLQVEMAKKRLGLRELEAVDRDLDGIITTKQQASDMVRALIRDLHRSPIGRAGLAEALHSFALDAGKSFTTQITTDVEEVTLPPPITLLIYQIAREATMNALKHAEAENIWVSLRNTDDGVALEVRDDGKGFDTAAPPPEGHFGSVMMKERAQVAGGTFSVTSELGHGSIIRASFPRVWVEEGTLHEAEGTSRVPESARAPVGSTSAATGMAIGGSKAQGQGSSDDEGAQPASEPTPRPHGSKEEEKEKDPRAARAVSA